MSIQSIAILGRGALGVMYGDFLRRHAPNRDVYFLADDARVERYRKETLLCNGRPCDFLYRTAAEVTSAPDLLIVALKGPNLMQALELVRPVISPQTRILSVMNGISSEDIIEQTLHTSNIIHCVAQRMDALFKDRVLTSRSFGELVIGLTEEHRDQKASFREVCSFFDAIGMPYVADDDIIHRMWCKWMLNVGVNQTLAVYNDNFLRVHQPGEARETLIGAMREVLALSQKARTGLTESDFRDYLRIIDELNPEGMPSMRQDRLAHRKTEVDLFAGTVIEKAKTYGLETPYNERLYREIKAFEASYTNANRTRND